MNQDFAELADLGKRSDFCHVMASYDEGGLIEPDQIGQATAARTVADRLNFPGGEDVVPFASLSITVVLPIGAFRCRPTMSSPPWNGVAIGWRRMRR